MPDDPLDPNIRKKAILKDLGVRAATLADWVRARASPCRRCSIPAQRRLAVGLAIHNLAFERVGQLVIGCGKVEVASA